MVYITTTNIQLSTKKHYKPYSLTREHIVPRHSLAEDRSEDKIPLKTFKQK